MIITHKESKVLNEFLAFVEEAAAEARVRILGDAHKAKEYEIAEREAIAFAAQNFSGDPGRSILSWAAAKKWSVRQAAEDILAAAKRSEDKLHLIRDARLGAKEAIKAANTAAKVQIIFDAYKKNMDSIV